MLCFLTLTSMLKLSKFILHTRNIKKFKPFIRAAHLLTPPSNKRHGRLMETWRFTVMPLTFMEIISMFYLNKINTSGSYIKEICDTFQCLNSIKVRVFFDKNIEKKHLHRLCKSNNLVINLIVGSRNMIKVSKNISLPKFK